MISTKGFAAGLAVMMLAQISLSSAAPQFLTFRDGKFGVNFGGYHAEAGLGGLLTGNAAHGGLSASAGTPHGQQAGAGLGGILDGNARTAGGLYAGATAGHGVGASAALGGGLNGEGGAGGTGAEAHAGGISRKVVKLGQTNGAAPPSETVLVNDQSINTRFNQEENVKTKTVVKEVHTDAPVNQEPVQTRTKTVYKKKVITRPHKVAVVDSSYDQGGIQTVQAGGSVSNSIDLNRFFDFQAFTNIAASFAHPAPAPAPVFVEQDHHHGSEIQKEVHVKTRFDSNGHSGGSGSQTHTSTVNAGASFNSNFWNDIFNIPISTLTAVNQFLNNKTGAGSGGASLHVQKHAEVH